MRSLQLYQNQLFNGFICRTLYYYGVNGNMKALIGFMWYVRRRVLWMLRRRSQVRKIRVAKFVELWDAFVKAPEVKVSIWGAVSTQTWGAVCGKSARTVLRGGGTQHAGGSFYSLGYLTVTAVPKRGVFRLGIPNKEIRETFATRIKAYFLDDNDV